MLIRLKALIYKEFLAVWRDKKSRFFLIIPPMIQLFIFAFAATLDVKHVSIGILNRDSGEKGFKLTEAFYHSKTFEKITHLKNMEEVAPFLNNQKGVFVLSIDEQFSRDLDCGKRAKVQCILDGRKSNTAQIVLGYLSTIIQHFASELQPKNLAKENHLELAIRHWYNPNLLYSWFTVPGLIGILTMLEALVIVALSVARERELGTFDQLLVSPLESTEILFGKTLPAIAIALAEGTILLLGALFIFKVPFTGSYFLLYLSMLVYIGAVIGFGLFLSALCYTQQQAVLGTFIFMAPAILLSGFATPIENMPEWLQWVTYANPARYFLKSCRALFLKATPWEIVWQQIWPMMVIACCMLTAATVLFRKKLQ
ncbi:MAG: ABC transporter permease [Chlamydiae bacterium]|nr:ABC transporter permease [Chlamydiota bacterium]